MMRMIWQPAEVPKPWMWLMETIGVYYFRGSEACMTTEAIVKNTKHRTSQTGTTRAKKAPPEMIPPRVCLTFGRLYLVPIEKTDIVCWEFQTECPPHTHTPSQIVVSTFPNIPNIMNICQIEIQAF